MKDTSDKVSFENFSHVARLAIPIIGSQLAMRSIRLVIIGMIGRLGANSLAAFGLASAAGRVFLVLSRIGKASQLLIARRIATRENNEAIGILCISMGFMLLIAIPMNITALFPEAIFRMLSSNAGVREVGAPFLRLSLQAFSLCLFNIGWDSFWMATGASGTIATISVIGMVIRLGVAWLLIPGSLGITSWGLQGDAAANLAAQVFAFTAHLSIFVFRWRSKFDVPLINVRIVKSLIQLGLPTIGNVVSNILGQIVFYRIADSVGKVMLATIVAWNGLLNLFFAVSDAHSVALITVVSMLIGKQRFRSARAHLMSVIAGLTIVSIVLIILLNAVPTLWVALVTDRVRIQNLLFSVTALLSIHIILNHVIASFDGFFRGTGNVGFLLTIHLVGSWLIQIPLAWLFTHMIDLGFSGLWYAQIGAQMVVLSCCVVFLKRSTWKAM